MSKHYLKHYNNARPSSTTKHPDWSEPWVVNLSYILTFTFEILHNQKLATTWRVRFYVYTALLVYAAFRVFFCFLMDQNDQFLEFFSITGPIWMYIELFDYVYTAISFAGILTNGLMTSNHQIQFYEELHDFDKQLAADFKIFVRRSRTRAINQWVLLANLVYCCGDFYYQYSWLSYAYTLAPIFLFLFTYYVSNILAFGSALQLISCTQLCRERLAIVLKLLRSYSNDSTQRLGKILHLYARICSQIVRINKFMGFVVLLKLFHDFTIGTSLLFMMCAYDNGITFTYSISWFVHTLLGTILMTLLSGILMQEVWNNWMKIIFEYKTFFSILLFR